MCVDKCRKIERFVAKIDCNTDELHINDLQRKRWRLYLVEMIFSRYKRHVRDLPEQNTSANMLPVFY